MDEPVVEVTRDPRSSRLPLIIVAAVLVVLVIVAWFYFLWPTKPEAVIEKTSQAPVAPNPEVASLRQVTEPVIIITQHEGGFSAQEVKPLQLTTGQYIYIVPLAVDGGSTGSTEVVTVDNNRVFGYTYVPEP